MPFMLYNVPRLFENASNHLHTILKLNQFMLFLLFISTLSTLPKQPYLSYLSIQATKPNFSNDHYEYLGIGDISMVI